MAESRTFRTSLPALWRILRRFWPHIRTQLPLIAGALLAMLAQIGLRLLEPWPLKFLFDRFFDASSRGPAMAITGPESFNTVVILTLLALSVVVITGLRSAASYLNTVGLALAGNRVLTEVRREVYHHLLRLSLAYHTQARNGDLITRITGDVGRLQEVAVTAILPLLVNSLTLIGMLGLMFWMNWQLALIAVVTFPLVSLSMARLTGRIRVVAREQRRREGAMAATAAESLSAIKVVQAFSLEQTLEHAFSRQNKKSLHEGVRGKRLAARLERSVDVLIAFSTALVLWYGAWLVLRNELTPGDLIVFTSYLKGAFRPMRDLAKYTGRIAKATAAGERVLDVLDTTPEIQDRPNAVSAHPFRGAVSFQAVSFSYNPQHPVLQDISFRVQAGQRVALVGPSGSGKSTLVSLLLRLYDPTQGRILIDGCDIHTYTLASLRAQTSVVLQESVLFAVSVYDNIAYGSPDATPEEIEIAARQANAHDFIQALPHGYDTILGERGATLSGGQRQRIAIARATVRRAPVVILDEPTTGLDGENEWEVQEALERLTEGCTTFLIAHDLMTAQHADMILYLEDGRILERGTHADLMRLRGRYAAMYTLQSLSRNGASRKEQIYALAS
ncbi:MAG: ABC transporter ATP-binding protein [Anaerolineae bacterium]